MDTDTTSTSPGQTTPNVVNKVADNASEALRSTQGAANTAFDKLSAGVESARDRAAPALDRLSQQAEELARRSIDTVRERSALLREKAVQLSDATTGRIRDEPLKAMLIAAATGAALMALLTLLSRSGDRR
jgi:ElaB/YqjD/DUF883 family membrane-anchored ribosome-binding protein